MATTEQGPQEGPQESPARRFWPPALLGLSLTGLVLAAALGGASLCKQIAPGVCGAGSYAVRIPLPSARSELIASPVEAVAAEQPDETTEPEESDAAVQQSFTVQFANLIDPQATPEPGRGIQPPVSTTAPATQQKPARLQDLNFDLGAGPEAASTIEVRKTVRLNGADVGTLNVRIDESARLYANGSQLAALLPPESVRPAASADQFLSFDQLRNAGVDIRYDPTQDRLTIAGK